MWRGGGGGGGHCCLHWLVLAVLGACAILGGWGFGYGGSQQQANDLNPQIKGKSRGPLQCTSRVYHCRYSLLFFRLPTTVCRPAVRTARQQAVTSQSGPKCAGNDANLIEWAGTSVTTFRIHRCGPYSGHHGASDASRAGTKDPTRPRRPDTVTGNHQLGPLKLQTQG